MPGSTTSFKNGAQTTAISVDTPEQNEAMIDELVLPFYRRVG